MLEPENISHKLNFTLKKIRTTLEPFSCTSQHGDLRGHELARMFNFVSYVEVTSENVATANLKNGENNESHFKNLTCSFLRCLYGLYYP